MSVPQVFNIIPLDNDGGRQDCNLSPARQQRHHRAARRAYVCTFYPTDEVPLRLRGYHAQICLLSMTALLATAAIWLSAPTVAAENP